MDGLSLRFAEESALRQIEECEDLAQLKDLAKTLIKAHFSAKSLLHQLMEERIRDVHRGLRSS